MIKNDGRPRGGSRRTRAPGGAAGRPLALALDRFAAALGRRRAPYGRGELLEILAEAFGHRNSHETSAAIAAGALAQRPVTPIGSATLSDGTFVVVGRDDRGNVLGVEPGAIGEGRHAPSPHGGIVDLGPLREGGLEAPRTGTWHVAEVSGGSRLLELVVADNAHDLREKVALLLVDGLLDDAHAPDGEFDAERVIRAYCAQERCAVTYHAPASLARQPDGPVATPFVEGVPERVRTVSVTYGSGVEGPGFVARTRGELDDRLAAWCVETYDLDAGMGTDAVLAWHSRERPDDLLTYASAEIDLRPEIRAADDDGTPRGSSGDATAVRAIVAGATGPTDGGGTVGPRELAARHDGETSWGQHPDHPMEDWRRAVGDGDTRVGYWSWVVDAIATGLGEGGGDASHLVGRGPEGEALALSEATGHWEMVEDLPPDEWRAEVASGDTRVGYWEWVASEREARALGGA